ncbi:hypothetical protein M434DRAFT_393246 [Hypoxylon sp. CO27-5]|nr:hypothetical protein M434DRAFT_393246 [Hypoxylon sp. CO27-5]
MCELHHQKCATCKRVWIEHKKLASCESQDLNDKCPENLCMYVGSPRRPIKGECESCKEARERKECLEEESTSIDQHNSTTDTNSE